MRANLPIASHGATASGGSVFSKFASGIAHLSGKPIAFFAAFAIIVVWAVTGPLFAFSDTWQLVVNTGTTIITFLMVFLIQNTQNRDTLALQLKLDELILATKAAHIDDNPYVFAGNERGRRHGETSGPPSFNSFGQRKAELDAKLPKKMPGWTLHDLRRTARSLLARAGVPDHIAERTLGHAIAGVQGVYNRHNYIDEKADALARLAVLVDQIVNPPDRTNVVSNQLRVIFGRSR